MTPHHLSPQGGGLGALRSPQANTLFNNRSCEKITSFWSNMDYGDNDRKGCYREARWLGDKTLCGRHLMCPVCNEIAASRKAAQYHRILNDDFKMSEEYGWPLRVDVITTTLPGKQSWIRHEGLQEQYNYMTARTNVRGIGGDHSMRGLNYKLNKWGYYGGCHFIEFTWNKHRKWWNVHNHTIAVGFETDVTLPIKETSQKDWSGLRYEKIPYVTHGGFTSEFKENGLGRRYSLDTAEHHEVADCIGYVAKLAYVTKPVKAPKEKRSELRRFFSIGQYKTEKAPRLTRPFGDWCRSRVWTEPI